LSNGDLSVGFLEMNDNIFKRISSTFDLKSLSPHLGAILFLKWIANRCELSQDGEYIVTFKNSPECFIRIREPIIFHKLVDSDSGDMVSKIELFFRNLEADNPRQLGGLFSWINFRDQLLQYGDDRYYFLKKITSICNDNRLNESQLLIQLFEHADIPSIETPPSIASLVSGIIRLAEGEKIYDPVCGNANLLLSCVTVQNTNSISIAGSEYNHTTWFFAKINLILNGFSSIEILNQDCFLAATPYKTKQQYDVVVGHPPWGEKLSHHPNLSSHFSNTGNHQITLIDYAFVLEIVGRMHPDNGRAAVLVSNGMLTRSGAESEIRRDLIHRNLLDAVISLPDKMFTSTSIGT
jgi:hypothetical protein